MPRRGASWGRCRALSSTGGADLSVSEPRLFDPTATPFGPGGGGSAFDSARAVADAAIAEVLPAGMPAAH
jgi:hypothetical protein